MSDPEQPPERGEDGKAGLEIIFAANESAGTRRKVSLPFSAHGEEAD